MSKQNIICLMGPTASGKTNLAIELTQSLPCEIISVDSALVYKGMNIGTAKPSAAELAKAPHRLIDICDPAENYSAGQFCQDVQREINDILNQNKIPLLVGGTMLYFYALQKGFADLPTADNDIRQQIILEANERGWDALHQQLMEIDSVAAQQIHQNDTQRIQRALEIYHLTGKKISEFHQQQTVQQLSYNFINIVIAPHDRSILHQRIEMRFKKMLEQGLIDEVKALHQREDLHLDLPSIRTVGYRQVWSYLDNEFDYDTMQYKAIVATRQFAKRQFTWLRRWKDAKWFDSESKSLREEIKEYLDFANTLRVKEGRT